METSRHPRTKGLKSSQGRPVPPFGHFGYALLLIIFEKLSGADFDKEVLRFSSSNHQLLLLFLVRTGCTDAGFFPSSHAHHQVAWGVVHDLLLYLHG